jgi:hypothetical protein
MPNYNLNSNYGQLTALAMLTASPYSVTGGKTFVVCPTAHPNFTNLQALFVPDADGTNRFFTTFAAAHTAATAARGDVIFIAEGYTEAIVGAAGNGVTKAGVRVIGLGDGANRPTFSFTTATAASFDITAANVLIQNVVFAVGFDAVTALVNVTAADVSFRNCEFRTNTGAFGAVTGITTAATATRLLVDSCRFVGPATNSGTTTTGQIKHESGIDYVISNNYFTGKMTQAIINVATVLGGLIDNNRAVVATGTLFATMAAASTPFIVNNRINVPSGTTPITAAAGFVAGNMYSAAAGVTSTGGTSSNAAVTTL